jgi:hypothetical protein
MSLIMYKTEQFHNPEHKTVLYCQNLYLQAVSVLERFKRAFGCFCYMPVDSRIIAGSIHTASCDFLCIDSW